MHPRLEDHPVVLLALAPELGLSGVTAYVGSLALALLRRGHGVISIRVKPSYREGVRAAALSCYQRVTVAYTDDTSARRLLLTLLRRQSPRVIHTHDDSLLALGSWLSARTRSPLVHTIHFVHPNTAEVLSTYRPTAVAVSRAVALELGVQLTVVPPFAEPRWPANRGLRHRAERARTRLGLAANDKLVLFAGRANSPTKGADILVAAADALWSSGNRMLLAFAGPFWLPPGAASIASRNTHRVIELGLLSRARLFVWYRAADTVVVPSRYEPLGLVALEAQSMGTPVIAAEVGGLAEIVHPGMGCLVRPRGGSVSPEDLASAVATQLSRRVSRRALAEWALSRFGEQAHVERLLDIYAR